MKRPRALDLYCRAGGISEGLRRAGFDVVGVDILDCAKAYGKGPGNPAHANPARFVQADALIYPLEGFDLICASPPCQAHSALRHLTKGKEYPELIAQTRERLMESGIPYAIENVPGAPLEGSLLVLCGTMFGLETRDGRAELRRHRHFETSFPITLRPECRHGRGGMIPVHGTGAPTDNRGRKDRDARHVITVTGDRPNAANTPRVIRVAGGMMTPQGERKRRTISITGATPQDNTLATNPRRRAVSIAGHCAEVKTGGLTESGRSLARQTFSTDDARHAMSIDWMAMKDLSQAIPPAYSHFLGLMFLGEDPIHLLAEGGCMGSLF